MTDLFNGLSSNYITPNFQPCAGANGSGDDIMEFLDDGQIGIINGSDILSFIDFSDISIPISAYNKETRVLQSGEVVYINGLTKGLLNRQQGFIIPELSTNNYLLDPFYMQIDFSINFYKNFKYYNVNLEASGNAGTNIPITTAANLVFSANSINVNLNLNDPSIFAFIGTVEGYDFDVSTLILTLIDDSDSSTSPFAAHYDASGNYTPSVYTLIEASAYDIPYARYPNGAMQGVLLKVIYPLPTSMTLSEWDKWIYLNHIRNEVTVLEPVTSIIDISSGVLISFNPLTLTPEPFINKIIIIDNSINYTIDVSDASINNINITNETVDGSVFFNVSFVDSSILNSIADTSTIINSFIQNSSINNYSISNSSITLSYIALSTLRNCDASATINLSNIFDTSINLSFIEYSVVNNTRITGSYLNEVDISVSVLRDSSALDLLVYDSVLTNNYVQDSSIYNSSLTYLFGNNIVIKDSSINNSIINGGKITNCRILDSSISNVSFVDCSISNTTVTDSSLVNSYFNESTTWDTSINYSVVKDSSLYRIIILDSSVSGSTLYNSTFLRSSNLSNRIILIDASLNSIVTYINTTLFRPVIKTVDAGLSGASTATVMSAGDYLDYVTTNEFWDKIGYFYLKATAPDNPDDDSYENLMNGFYLYNPQTYDVKVEYMVFV